MLSEGAGHVEVVNARVASDGTVILAGRAAQAVGRPDDVRPRVPTAGAAIAKAARAATRGAGLEGAPPHAVPVPDAPSHVRPPLARLRRPIETPLQRVRLKVQVGAGRTRRAAQASAKTGPATNSEVPSLVVAKRTVGPSLGAAALDAVPMSTAMAVAPPRGPLGTVALQRLLLLRVRAGAIAQPRAQEQEAPGVALVPPLKVSGDNAPVMGAAALVHVARAAPVRVAR